MVQVSQAYMGDTLSRGTRRAIDTRRPQRAEDSSLPGGPAGFKGRASSIRHFWLTRVFASI